MGMTTTRLLRRLTAHDALQAGVLIWWGIALSQVPAAQRAVSPLFVHMGDIAPYQAWIALPFVLAVALVVSSVVGYQRGLVIALIATATWWGLFTWLLWIVSQTYLVPGLTAAFALAAVFRQAELRAPDEQ